MRQNATVIGIVDALFFVHGQTYSRCLSTIEEDYPSADIQTRYTTSGMKVFVSDKLTSETEWYVWLHTNGLAGNSFLWGIVESNHPTYAQDIINVCSVSDAPKAVKKRLWSMGDKRSTKVPAFLVALRVLFYILFFIYVPYAYYWFWSLPFVNRDVISLYSSNNASYWIGTLAVSLAAVTFLMALAAFAYIIYRIGTFLIYIANLYWQHVTEERSIE